MDIFKKKKTLTAEQQEVHDSLTRVCEKLQIKNFAELERTFGYSKAWTTNNIKRASMPFELLRKVAADTQTSLDWLVFGKPEGIDENALLPVKQGITNGLLTMSSLGFLKEEFQTSDDLDHLAKLLSEHVETELNLNYIKHKKTA